MFVAQFREDIQTIIPAIAEGLKDSHSKVRMTAIDLISRLAAQGMCYHRFPVGVLKRVCS